MKRREFIQKTGVSGAAGTFCALQLQAAEEVPKPMFRGRIYKSVKYGGRVNLERLKKLKELGFDGVEGSGPGMDLVGLKKACSEVGLPMHGAVYNKHWKMRLSSPNEEVRDIGRGIGRDILSISSNGKRKLLVPFPFRDMLQKKNVSFESGMPDGTNPLTHKFGLYGSWKTHQVNQGKTMLLLGDGRYSFYVLPDNADRCTYNDLRAYGTNFRSPFLEVLDRG